MAEASEAVTEAVSAIRVVHSFNAQKQEARRYGNLLRNINTLKVRQGTANAVCLLARRVSLIVVAGAGARRVYFVRVSPVCAVVSAPVADRFGHAGPHVVLRETVYPEGTDDNGQPGFLRPLPLRPWAWHHGTKQPPRLKGRLAFTWDLLTGPSFGH